MKRHEVILAALASVALVARIPGQSSPLPEALPAQVLHLSRQVHDLRTSLGQLDKTVAGRVETIQSLEKELADSSANFRSEVEAVRAELAGSSEQVELRLRSSDGSSTGVINAEQGSGYGLTLSATPSARNVELVAQEMGGLLRFFDKNDGLVASLGTEAVDDAGYLELMSAPLAGGTRVRTARLGSQANGSGGVLTLNDARGKELVLLRTTADGCELILGDRHRMTEPGTWQGIVLSVSPKGSYITVDGKRIATKK